MPFLPETEPRWAKVILLLVVAVGVVAWGECWDAFLGMTRFSWVF
jgi:hypothetical protein